MPLSRRAVLGASAAVAASMAAPPLRAAAPQAGKQAPAFYRYKVGSIEITVVNDGVSRMPIGEGFVSNASKDQVNAALEAAFLEKDFYAGPYNPIVINTGSQACPRRHRYGRGGLPGEQGAQRPASAQPGGRRHRRERHRCRHRLALSRRPHQRPAQSRQFDRLSECGNSGAGERAQFLDGRRRDEPRIQAKGRRRIQECAAPDGRRGRSNACGPTNGTRKSSPA